MAGTKISELPVATTLTGAELVPVVQSGATKQTTLAQMPYVPDGTGAVTTTVQTKLRETVSVFDFGAKGDGVTDDTAAIQAALNSGTKLVRAPAGTYKLLGTLTIPDNVSIEGDGAGATIFDGSGATYSSLTSGRHIQTEGGILTQIADRSSSPLASAISIGDRTVVFASAPSVSAGDVLVLYNPDDYSWSNFRSYYRAGEMVRVAKVSGSTVTIHGTFADAYLTNKVNVYRLDGVTRCTLKGFTLKGLSGASGAVTGMYLRHMLDSSVEDVRVWNCSYTQVAVVNGFNVQIRGVTCEEDFTNNYSGDYGLAIWNSQHVDVSGGYFGAARHGFTTGGGSDVGDITCRYVHVHDATLTTSGDAQAADFHGNTEYSGFHHCVMDGGFSGGGDFIYLTSNTVKGGASGNGNIAVYISEMRGGNIKVSNNTIFNDKKAGSGFGAIIYGALQSEASRGGVVDISNNTMIWDATGDDANAQAVVFYGGYNGSELFDIRYCNNSIQCRKGGRFGYTQFAIVTASARLIDTIEIVGNKHIGVNGGYIRNSITSTNAAKKVVIRDNVIEGCAPGIPGVFIEDVRDYIEFQGNHFTNISSYPVHLSGLSSTSQCFHVDASNNTIVNNLNVRTSSSSTNVGLVVVNATYATIHDNVTGSLHEWIGVTSNASFVIGETITGGTSGATATVTGVRSTTEIMIERTRSGTFTVAETITGGTSGATTTITSAAQYCQTSRLRVADITNLHMANNFDLRSLSDSVGTITTHVGTSDVGLADGVSAPPTRSGQASIYVDSADGDLKIKFGDGVVKTIVTDV